MVGFWQLLPHSRSLMILDKEGDMEATMIKKEIKE
jgi:hypothetical protein